MKFHTFSTSLGKKVFWHSSSHILGYALELYYQNDQKDPKNKSKNKENKEDCQISQQKFQCLLADGPANENGFFYDCFIKPTNDDFNQSQNNVNEKENNVKNNVK